LKSSLLYWKVNRLYIFVIIISAIL
jgi:hypothetical protein